MLINLLMIFPDRLWFHPCTQVQIEVQTQIVQDQLKGDQTTEIRVKFVRKLDDALPPGEN